MALGGLLAGALTLPFIVGGDPRRASSSCCMWAEASARARSLSSFPQPKEGSLFILCKRQLVHSLLAANVVLSTLARRAREHDELLLMDEDAGGGSGPSQRSTYFSTAGRYMSGL